MKKYKFSLFCFVLFLTIRLLPAHAQNPHYIKAVEEKIHAVENNLAGWVQIKDSDNTWNLHNRMGYYHIRGLSIAVIHDNKIEWARGYGLMDMSTQQPVTARTLFQAGSISKSLNAMVVLKLAQEKKISLYANINDYLKSWKFPYDSVSKGEKITIAELLSHTAGLSVHGFGGYGRNDSLPTLPEILNGAPPANSPAVRSLFEPGLRYQYSGGGVTITQLIVEDVTGQSYDTYMRNNVLQPLGMTMSSYIQPPTKAEQKYLATGYHANGEEVDTKYHVYPEEAAAGLWTNPMDLAKYIIATQLSLKGESNKVLSQKMTQLRLTPYIDPHAALGVFIEIHDGEKYFGHDGANEGFRASYKGSFDNGNGVVVMVNSDNPAILNEVVNSVATVYGWKDFYSPVIKKVIELPDSLVNKYAGKYLLGSDTLTISRKGNSIFLQLNHVQSAPIYFSSERDFFSRNTQLEFKMETDNSGNVKDIYFKEGENELRAKKL